MLKIIKIKKKPLDEKKMHNTLITHSPRTTDEWMTVPYDYPMNSLNLSK